MIRTFLRAMLKPLSFLPALCMMYVIFTLSAQEGSVSSGLSMQVSGVIVDVAEDILDQDWSDARKETYAGIINPYVRKLAHVTEYFLLAVSVSFPLYVYGVRGIALMLLAGGICVGFAALDEYHQSFVSGRSPSERDVMIDSIGIVSGVILVRIVCFIGRKTIFRPLSKKKRKRRRC